MDIYLFQQINQLAGNWTYLDNLGIFFAKYSGYILVILLFSFLFFRNREKYKVMVIEAFSAAILARLVIANIIRFIYFRPRPFIDHQVNLLLNREAGGSFPSGHASFFFALSFIVYCFNKKAGILFLIVSFLMSVARIFVGIHYPLDVLGGIFIGIISGWFINKYLRNYIQRIFSLKMVK